MELSEFLLARIVEDEAEIAAGHDFATLDSDGWMGHAATWGRERALAECEKNRRLVVEWGPFETYNGEALLKVLALPYTDHPDYREEWRP